MNDKEKILVVDDNNENLSFLSNLLKEVGYFVLPADSGELALASLEENTVDLILLDIRMPGINGFEVCKQIKQQNRLANIPIIFLTAATEIDDKLEGFRLGAVDYITKPFHEAELMVRIATHLKLHHYNKLFRVQSAEKLIESEQKYRTLFDGSFDIVMTIDNGGNIVSWNRRAEEVYGYKAKEIIGRNVSVLVPEELVNEQKEIIANVKSNGFIEGYESIRIAKSGKRIPVEMTISTMKDSDGNLIGLSGILRDITKRKQAEDALRESEHRFRTIVQKIPIPLCHVNINTGEIKYVNNRFVEIFGYSLENIPNLSDWWELAYPDEKYRTWVVNNWNEAVAYGTKQNTDITPAIYDVTCKNTEVRQVFISGIVLGDDFLATFIDYTERNKAEDAIRKSEAQKQAILDGISTNIAFLNKDLEILWTNKTSAVSVGKLPEEMIGHKCHRFWGDPEKVCDECPSMTALQTKKYDHKIIHSPDGKIWDEGGAPVFDPKGNLIGVIAIAHDITDRKNAEEEIKKHRNHLEELVKERTKEIESFSYSVSHDLRAPLRAIDGFSEILSDEYKDKLDDEAKRLISVIRKNTKDMNHLISDLLDFSRLGRKELKPVEINMASLVKKIIDEQKQMFPNTKFKLGNIPPVMGDRNLIHIVITNLISNAVKFSMCQKVPEIEIGFIKKNKISFYFVKDNGVGFDMKYVDKIFGVFQRLHSSEDFEGTGVGLAIVQKIIQKHGGEVMAKGEVDKGATFYFSLPKIENS